MDQLPDIFMAFSLVDSFGYPGDMISIGGGCEYAANTRARTAEICYPSLAASVALKTKGRVYDTCVYAMLCYTAVSHGP